MSKPARPPQPGSAVRARGRGLKPADAAQLQRAMGLMHTGSHALAGLLLLDLARIQPPPPELLRAQGLWHAAAQDWPEAATLLQQAHALQPFDLPLLLQLADVQDAAHDAPAAQASLQAAAALARSADDWLAVSLAHDRLGDLRQAHHSVQRALALQPAHPVAQLQRARCATALGHAQQAAADCRALIARQQLVARAWFMLVDLKTVPLDSTELAALAHTAAQPPAALSAEERLYLQFALGIALEHAGRLPEAFAALCQANVQAASTRPWDADAFAQQVQQVLQAFGNLPPGPSQGQGREVVFLVGLPRSGTTLVEQILASHSQVEGASELPYLGQVIAQESRRLGQPFPAWVASATDQDWARLGQAYLQMSARWRHSKPVATDKLPDNWLYAGAALRMLPGARVIDCRRDPLETCWSCFKQLFGPGMVHFSYSFERLASQWHTYEGASRFWARRLSGQYRLQHYEALVAEPEAQVRALLAFCGLDYEAGCLEFYRHPRAVRTPSALQVRQPLGPASRPGAAYGALLDPLRALLPPP